MYLRQKKFTYDIFERENENDIHVLVMILSFRRK